MEPREFLRLAGHLVVTQSPAASTSHFRTAIGRAYYAAFNFTCNVLAELGFPASEGPKAHILAARLLQQSGDHELATTGGLLDDLHGVRIKADYHPWNPTVETKESAQAAVETAQDIFGGLDSFLISVDRKVVVIGTLTREYKSITGKTLPTSRSDRK
jgi:hypothetical protein